MTVPVPTTEPDEAVIGDSWHWTRSMPTFPANAGWSLTYFFKKADASFQIACTTATDGQSFDAYAAPATTAALRPGRYNYQGRVTNGTDSFVVDDARGELLVLPDPAAVGALDARSQAKLVVEQLKALSLRRAGGRVHVVIDGQAIQFDTQADIMRALTYWEGRLEAETNKYRIAKGMGSLRTIRTRV
jgi:hypothetical protein